MDAPPPSRNKDLDARHLNRVRLTLWFGATFLSLQGIGWAVFYSLRGVWGMVLVDVGILLVGLSVWLFTLLQRTRVAFYLFLFGAFIATVWSAVINDIPNAHIPRATHLYLLAVALTANLFLRADPPVLRRGVVGIFLVTFIALASTNFGVVTPYAMPDSVRGLGTWVHTILAVVAMVVLFRVMVSDLVEGSSLQADLRKGLEHDEFFLLYQAQVTSDGEVTGAEALLRWNHPKRGLVSPGEFIAVAEQTGLIPLGIWVLKTACAQLANWAQQPGMEQMTLSVNASAQQFSQTNFVAQVQTAVRDSGANPRRLKVELTESMLAQDIEDIIQKMHALKAIGVGTSLDDFGTGFSSLSYLKRMPLDQLKIDQSFVRDVLTNENDASIAKTIINLGKDLHFTVIAEGVETTGQRDFLMQNGCHRFQGYLFSTPVTAAAFLQICQLATKDRALSAIN